MNCFLIFHGKLIFENSKIKHETCINIDFTQVNYSKNAHEGFHYRSLDSYTFRKVLNSTVNCKLTFVNLKFHTRNSSFQTGMSQWNTAMAQPKYWSGIPGIIRHFISHLNRATGPGICPSLQISLGPNMEDRSLYTQDVHE
jgi:hypothetical protein